MKKLPIPILFIVVIYFTVIGYNAGPLPENTGAPGEMTCYRSGCHVNSGIGIAETFISFEDTANLYENSKEYSLNFGFSKKFSNEHGFQIVALDDNNNNVGTWITGGSNLYQVKSGTSLPDRRYLEHTFAGSAADTWTVKWQSPGTYQGNIKFYAAFLESNNNNNQIGDTLYTEVLTLQYDILSGKEEAVKKRSSVYSYGNTIHIKNHQQNSVNALVIDINGKIIRDLIVNPGSKVNDQFSPGLYIIQIKDNALKSFQVEKVMVY